MIKILYCCQSNVNSKYQLLRFLDNVKDKNYNIKIAAYKQHFPNINVDWNLECLINIFRPESLSLKSDNFSIYYEQVKSFSPDLIISDLEYFTSYIAQVLNIPIWQCSSSLINFSIENKYGLGLFKNYSYIYYRNERKLDLIYNIIDNADRNFVYSHFGDCDKAPVIKNNFEWARPYHKIGKESIFCQHDIVAALPKNNKKTIEFIKQQSLDSVVFTDFYYEQYKNVIMKNIEDVDEYYCNLFNSNLFVTEGQTTFLADAFYNGKSSLIDMDFQSFECIANKVISEKLNTGHSNIEIAKNINVSPYLNDVLHIDEAIDKAIAGKNI
jgi:uncharacterized protein (TIGR00661 family)